LGLLFLAIVGIQFCLQEFQQFANKIRVVWPILIGLSFISLCFFNNYRRKFPKQTHGILGKIWNGIKSVVNGITSAFEELSHLIDPFISIEKSQYLLKTICIVCYTQIIPKIQLGSPFSVVKTVEETQITPLKAFVFYLCFVFASMFRRFVRDKLHEYNRKYKKDKLSGKSIFYIENKGLIQWINVPLKLSSLMLLFLPLCNGFTRHFTLCKLLIMGIPFILEFIFVCICCCIYLKEGIPLKFKFIFQIIFFDSIISPIKNYIKNHNRLYLRINFGHKLKDEKDILRLTVRTLSTEYSKFGHSFKRMLPRRVMVFGVLFLFSSLFSDIVKNQELYKSIKDIVVQQEFDETIRDVERLKDVFFNAETKIGSKVSVLLLASDQLFSEILGRTAGVLLYLWNEKEENVNPIGFSINYLFCLSFILMYLFCKLLFRCSWITHFFVTHQIIRRRLKNLNLDITHKTELENSIGINSEKIGSRIGVKSKRSRSVADAREIEKELQDILNDIRQIPIIMCRPKIVIVFDELDKVEPGDASLEKEIPQTKASLFSIGATRERQTEILRILSNMKYFLSTARAKFIFIAGREIFDIHLADVSERNNYIGSIFNVVILVPSFLTDHHTGIKLLPQESSIASLPEEFVCRKLIPQDYPVETYDLKNYRVYLERDIP